MNILNNLYINLDLVLSKRTSLDHVLNPSELKELSKKAEKNRWDEDSIKEYVYRYLKSNITDFLDNSDFMDANVIIESDPYIIKAMELMSASQRHAEVLLVDKEYKYPGCWVDDISNALKGLECKAEDYNILVWEAYFMRNYEINSKIPGWTHLADILEDYYNTL
jgi:hypothetical protein